MDFCDSILWNGTTGTLVIDSESLTVSVAIWITLAFAVFAVILAKGFTWIRSYVFQDKDNLDTSFDAGGKVNIGITAATIVSQWTWAATLLQSSSVAAKYGISGPFWYAAGATVQLLLFAALSVQLKIKAPGAKTFLQVTYARFGSRVHLVFCFMALLTNFIVTVMMMMGGTAVMMNLVPGFSLEMASLILAAMIGSYTFIGGLGATFYMSYFNTGIIFIGLLVFLSKVYVSASDPEFPLGSVDSVYEYITCGEVTSSSNERYFSFLSSNGLMFGIINLVGNFGTVFVDQSYWQSGVAAKPREGMWGFISGGLVWFAIPFTFAATMGFSFLALSSYSGEQLITDDQINEGLVAPTIARALLGYYGEVLMFIIILMAVTSTGSAECIAITSILVYDLYKLHWKPYKVVEDVNACEICGKNRGRHSKDANQCVCVKKSECPYCVTDDKIRNDCKDAVRPGYKCSVHGEYRAYLDFLGDKRDWCVVLVSLANVPITLIFALLDLKMGWLYTFMGIPIASAVVPIILSVTWGRLTGKGMIFGAIGGMVLGVVTLLITSSLEEGGLGNGKFFENTGKEFNMLMGNIVAIAGGAVFCVATSLIYQKPLTEEEEEEVWEKTRDIDNPLMPWSEHYTREFNIPIHLSTDRPTLAQMKQVFRKTKRVSIGISIVLSIFLVMIWPAVMASLGDLSLGEFTFWIGLSQAWAYTAATFIIVVPLALEIHDIYVHYKRLKTPDRCTDKKNEVELGNNVAAESDGFLQNGNANHKEPLA
ncbi:uncharacterized protein [Antedon mediterranea]|uniref:uncharacterized protein n=1 Tax=Antedon mediterranea TaxID=105859 RepID=UPI003AF4DED7